MRHYFAVQGHLASIHRSTVHTGSGNLDVCYWGEAKVRILFSRVSEHPVPCSYCTVPLLMSLSADVEALEGSIFDKKVCGDHLLRSTDASLCLLAGGLLISVTLVGPKSIAIQVGSGYWSAQIITPFRHVGDGCAWLSSSSWLTLWTVPTKPQCCPLDPDVGYHK
jgi:hypothetical protein